MAELRIQSPDDLDGLMQGISRAATGAIEALKALPQEPLPALAAIKFEKIGMHPIEHRSLNLIEQVNQTFTCLASIKAAHILLERHPNSGGLLLRMGTQAGIDIESFAPQLVAAEVFSATSPNSNDKLNKDFKALEIKAPGNQHRYVFFSCPGYKEVAWNIWNLFQTYRFGRWATSLQSPSPYPTLFPPSTVSTWPVIMDDSSLSR